MSSAEIVVWGHPLTRANRPLWLLRELGLPYRVESSTHFLDDAFPSAMKKQPALVDADGTVVFESLAINLYLVRKYGEPIGHSLVPRTDAEHAATYQWTMFAMTELDPRLFELLFHSKFLEAAGHPLANDSRYADYFGRQRSATRAARLRRELEFPLRVLDAALRQTAPSGYLLGSRFSAVDLNVAVVLDWANGAGVSLAPTTKAWLKRCVSRPLSPRNTRERGTPPLSALNDDDGLDRRYGSLGFVNTVAQARL